MNVEQIVRLAVESGVLSEAAAGEHASAWEQAHGSSEDGDGFVEQLVRAEAVSDFHADALKAGIAGPYKLGPYRLYDRIAAGRLGTIYRAVHEEFDQAVSLKIFPAGLKDDSEKAMRLARETRIAVQVNHPNVVRTFQVGKVGEVVFLAIEDLQGETLASALEREKKLPVDEACRLIRDAAQGLSHLHELGIVLRDIRPANIWVTSDGHAKLMEFGAARDALADLDAPDVGDVEDEIRGTYLSAELLASYDYMSPEQGADEMHADVRSDIYALGCILFHALTGDVVFPDVNPVRKALRHAREEPRLVSEVDPAIPHAVADVVRTMLAKQPEDRYQQPEDVVWALGGLITIEEDHEAVAEEINEDFLAWANSTGELSQDENIPTVVAEPQFIGFLDWVAEQEEEDER